MHKLRRIFKKTVWQMKPGGMVLVPEECESFLYCGPVAEAVALLYAPNYGVAGDISRPHEPYVATSHVFNSAAAFAAYGVPGKIVAGLFVPIAANNDVVEGLLVRPFPMQDTNTADGLNTATPPVNGPASVLRKGYAVVNLQLNAASAAFGGAVYIRYQNPTGGQIVGGLEGATTGNNYAWPNARFEGVADANGNVEISFGNAGI